MYYDYTLSVGYLFDRRSEFFYASEFYVAAAIVHSFVLGLFDRHYRIYLLLRHYIIRCTKFINYIIYIILYLHKINNPNSQSQVTNLSAHLNTNSYEQLRTNSYTLSSLNSISLFTATIQTISSVLKSIGFHSISLGCLFHWIGFAGWVFYSVSLDLFVGFCHEIESLASLVFSGFISDC